MTAECDSDAGRHLVTGQRLAVQTFVMDRPISQRHAVRQSYDAVAKEYMECFRGELAGKPLDRALLLLYLEDKSQREIAEVLGITQTNVSTKISRLKQKMRAEI